MGELFVSEEKPERAVLVGLDAGHDGFTDADAEESLDELKELAETAGAEAVGRMIQKRTSPDPETYLGSGKISELKEMMLALDADLALFDDELSPAQTAALSDMLDTKVLDRTSVILDIFARHAVTNEGKIQVELAQLKYRSTRLTGKGNALSRLGGGIGTRGPGEKKLETDRRLIRNRIGILSRELEEMKKSRETTRKRRDGSGIPIIALVGYTNTGKSTLLNKLTGSDVVEENKLFATLDPTTRNMKLENGQEILLTDTVGFIRKLPHHLIDAFRSTLEEAKYADIILHVADASSESVYPQMETVYRTLAELQIQDKPVITALNKQDLLSFDTIIRDPKADCTVRISAKTGQGLAELKAAIGETLKKQRVPVDRTFSYADAAKIQLVRKYGQLDSEEYDEDGIRVRGWVPKEIFRMLLE
ncbi:MAG: GTPase HflX [Lachnospiraceae bacterium]|jgi:GTP-binding protein HflX|nr:GTPase HflX [Lachnospiraceae bacterium]